MTDCIDLADRFGANYWLGLDPAARTPTERDDPWMRTLLCEYGVIYPQGGDMLAVEVDGHRNIARRLAALPCCSVHQDGDDERTFLFDVKDFSTVAAVVQARRRVAIGESFPTCFPGPANL